MEKINTNINLISKNSIINVPLSINIEELEDENVIVELKITYNQRGYIGKGTNCLLEDAFADLQKNFLEMLK